jgi:signal transduction histidine kinase
MLDVRRVVEGLRPPALDELGLAGALQQAVSRLTAATATQVAVDIDVPERLPAALEVAAYRIVTEAVTNVVRHSGASRCEVAVSTSAAALVVDVTDDGTGLRTETRTHGHGLTTMRERAEELGGMLIVTSGGTTRVRAEIPLAQLPQQPTPAVGEAARR